MEKGILLPSLYMPPVSFFALIKRNKGTTWVEAQEHFPKQTYRNRCVIYSPNGPLKLSIPIRKGASEHTKMRDVRISYDVNWQRLHWMSIQTAYRSSPYFEFYEDEFASVFFNKERFLFDYNQKALHFFLDALKLRTKICLTDAYEKYPENVLDFRMRLHPKKPPLVQGPPYYQVFEDKHGFIPDLSIIDLLFSQGPGSTGIL